MHCLFICDTEFQLLNALNIKYHLLKDDTADILVHNRHPEDGGFVDRIKNTGLFQNVYSYIDELKGVHQYIRDIQYSQKGLTLFESLQNSAKMGYFNLREKLLGVDEILSNRIEEYEHFKQNKYDEVFAYTNGKVYRTLLTQLKNTSSNFKLNFIDEGIGSYLDMHIDGIEADSAYLYEPDISICHDRLEHYVRIPKINGKETEFIDLLNIVFGATELSKKEIDNAIIFCDVGFQKMPPYLSNSGKITRTILSNAYKKHKKLSFYYDEEIRLFKKIINLMSAHETYIKFHPRYATTMIDEFNDVNLKILAEKNLPFELISANFNIKNSLFISPFSSSAILHHPVLGKIDDGNRYILLHRIMAPGRIEKEVELFYDNLITTYGDKYFIPDTEKELVDFLARFANNK